MSSSNEDLSIKLATMEAQISSVVDSVSRIEASITRLILIDRTMAELAVSSLHTKEAIVTANRDIEAIKSENRIESQLVNARVDFCSKLIGESKDKITFASGAVWVLTACIGIILMVSAWMFNRIDYNHKLVNSHEQRIESNGVTIKRIEREIEILRKNIDVTTGKIE